MSLEKIKKDKMKQNKMKMKIRKIIKSITYDKILAIIFLLLIFFISTATIPLAFEEVGKVLKNKKTNVKKKTINTIKELDKTYEGMLDFDSNIINNKGAYINLNGLMARIMGQKQMNDVTLLNNGHLARIRYKKFNLDVQIEQMTKLYNKQKERDKDFLFVLAPSQISKYEDLVPDELKKGDYTNYNGDKLLEGLKENGVPYLDLREELHKDGIKHEDAFFRTDHHWNIETGFWAYTKIINRLKNDKIISNVDKKLLDLNNYNIEVKKDLFLGASGKRVGKYFNGVDDFPIITPKFDTDFKVNFVKDGSYKKGTLEETMLDSKEIEVGLFSGNIYRFYSYGVDKDLKIKNNKYQIDKRILTIGDSFARSLLPKLSLIFSEVYQRDMRYYKNNFAEEYKNLNPDILIVLINEDDINENINYDFFPEENKK